MNYLKKSINNFVALLQVWGNKESENRLIFNHMVMLHSAHCKGVIDQHITIELNVLDRS